MFLYFEANNLSLENEFSSFKRKLWISSPLVLYRAILLGTSKAKSTTNLEGHLSATLFSVISSYYSLSRSSYSLTLPNVFEISVGYHRL